MRTWAAAVAALTLALLLGGEARALPPKPFELRIDSFSAYDSDTRHALGSNFPAFGVGLDVMKKNWLLPLTYNIYADYYRRIRDTDTTGRVEAQVWGLGIGARYDFFQNEQSSKLMPYARVGVGVYNSYVKQNTPDGFGQSNQRTSIGGKFALGLQHRSGVFLEGGYEFVPHPSLFGEDAALSGWLIGGGVRF